MLLIYFFFTVFLTPILTDEVLKFTIEEKSPINTFIADLSNELKIKNVATYSLFKLLPINKNLFSIDNQTGYLTTTTVNLDREELCLKHHCSCYSCEIPFQLIIQTEEKIFYKIIEIKILDRNDHSPIFNNQSMIHIIHIKENVPLGYRIILPSATDPDEGLNSIQSYSLHGINSDDFDIDYSFIDIPYLIVRSSLDHQRISSYSLTLIASDKSRTGSIQLDIRIINESIPIFLQSVYHIDIREDTLIGTNLLKIEAINENNKKNFYEFLIDSPFIIDRLTGNIQLKKSLDYEKQQSYRLIVKAYDEISLIPSYAIVFIRVIDINDNPVLIHIKTEGNTTLEQIKNKNIFFIPEDTSIDTIFGHVILNDFDSFTNGNPYLQLTTIQSPLPFIYKLIYQNNFQNLKFYSLILHTKLDRELKSIYNNIKLLAHDSGTPTLHTKFDLLLNITDINDCIPTIQRNSTPIYNINENNPIGLILDILTAYDCDLGINSQYEYSIINQTDLLNINSKTGQLSLKKSIDFEKLNVSKKNIPIIDLEFFIKIKDYGQPSLSSQFKIILRIHDLNDHTPEFNQNQSYNWTFSKSILQSGSVLGRIIAHDDDFGLQGIVHYSINSFDSCLILDITSLGYVYFVSQSSCSFVSYTFEIIASDYGTPNPRFAKQLLFIHIDTNDKKISSLPQLLPLSIHRTIVDINSLGNLSFIIDITTNQSIQPRIFFNNTDLSTCWSISSTGEVRLIDQPYALSYILTINIFDEYTEENFFEKLQIDICNSSIMNSCKRLMLNNNDRKENEILLFWAICLALIITCICIIIFSIMTCLCCRKKKRKQDNILAKNQQNFMQFHEDIRSEKTYKTSSGSTIRDDDHDSACIINTNSSSLSSGIIPIRIDRDNSSNSQNYQSSTYFYDLKLAELIRNNPNPPCVYLNSQSLSSDYGFASSEPSPSITSCSSIQLNRNSFEWNIEMNVDQSPQKPIHKNTFISTHECVV